MVRSYLQALVQVLETYLVINICLLQSTTVFFPNWSSIKGGTTSLNRILALWNKFIRLLLASGSASEFILIQVLLEKAVGFPQSFFWFLLLEWN